MRFSAVVPFLRWCVVLLSLFLATVQHEWKPAYNYICYSRYFCNFITNSKRNNQRQNIYSYMSIKFLLIPNKCLFCCIRQTLYTVFIQKTPRTLQKPLSMLTVNFIVKQRPWIKHVGLLINHVLDHEKHTKFTNNQITKPFCWGSSCCSNKIFNSIVELYCKKR